MTPIPVGSARVCRPDDVVDSDIVKASVAEPQGWDPIGGAQQALDGADHAPSSLWDVGVLL